MSINATILTVDPAGNPAAGVKLLYSIAIPPTGTGFAYDSTPHTVTSDVNGLIQFGVALGATYNLWSGLNPPISVTIPLTATTPYQLPNWTFNIVT